MPTTDSFRMKKAIYYMNVIDKFSYENALVVGLKDGILEDDHFYLFVNLLASRSPHWTSFPLYSMIVIILLITISALFFGLNLSFTSITIMKKRFSKKYYTIMQTSQLAHFFATSLCAIFQINDDSLSFLPLTFVTCIIFVIFGELFPLAICNRRGLQTASKTRFISWFVMIILSPVIWPISKILDAVLGSQRCEVYDKSKVEFLILESARTNFAVFSEILKNAINLPRIRVGDVMMKINEAFLLSTTDALDSKKDSKRSKVTAVLNVKDPHCYDFNEAFVVIDISNKLHNLKQKKSYN
uniref:CNNM transmembrane domain-containing protein n=1 Tax=Onchocerca volvulus TaxID=6282 RepID=A0A8R1TYR6_ONCVO